MAEKTVHIEEINGREGNCITINDTRIAGPKPWGGGYVIRKWDARIDHIIDALGVDVVPVVRCKDCKYFRKGKPFKHECKKVNSGMFYPNPDDFCSYGERKTDD